MTLALIDGDIVAYRASVVQQKEFRWDSDTVSVAVTGSSADAAEAAVQTIRAWAKMARAKDVRVAFTGRWNWRKLVLPTYKANRTKGKPLVWAETVEAVSRAYETDVVDGLEADDILGILMTTERYADKAIILSIDKDLRTVPGRHLNPLKETRPVLVTPDEADHRWLMQSLTGDSVDGYPGIPGVGQAKALKVLGDPPRPGSSGLGARLWPKVVQAYRDKKLTLEDALTQARVARILRRSDYDKRNKEILLWHPTEPKRLPLVLPGESPKGA